MKTDPRVDAYIAKAAAFARPILNEVRERIRAAWPTAEETIKWNAPFYVVRGKILVSMAAFKNHAKVGVWTGVMPSFVDVTSVGELPSAKSFAQQVRTAAKRIVAGISGTGETKAPTKEARGAKTAAAKPAAKKASTKPGAKKPAAKRAAKAPAPKRATKSGPKKSAARKTTKVAAVAPRSAAKKRR